MLIQKDFYKWARLGLINLVVVAFLGVLLRYKIAFSFPIVDQKHLLHGHSHFAFSGWISQILMTYMVWIISDHQQKNKFQEYRYLLGSNALVAYLMLFAFSYQGYGNVSIPLSVLSIIISYIFTLKIWNDLRPHNLQLAGSYFRTALIFNFISTLGTFWLAYLTAKGVANQKLYLTAVYFYLHFQYNGWFIFSSFGILTYLLHLNKVELRGDKKIFIIFSYTLIPCFLLSMLWSKLPIWIYVLVVVAALLQLVAWIWMLVSLKIHFKNDSFRMSHERILFYIPAIALSIKFILQALSTIPMLSTFAFGYRPVVIGYLHLIMLGIVTLFILISLKSQGILASNNLSKWGMFIFLIGFILNEVLLMFQALSFIDLIYISFSNEFLFAAAVIMLVGLIVYYLSFNKQVN